LGRLNALDINITGLLLGDPGDYRPGLEALGASPHATALASLRLDGHHGLARHALWVLSPSRHLPNLARLGLAGTGLDDEALSVLPGSRLAAHLAHLDCTFNPRLTTGGVGLLLDGDSLPGLTSLDLDARVYRVRSLLGTAGLPRLTRLRVQHEEDISGEAPLERGEVMSLDGLPELLASRALVGLEELILQGIDLGDEGLRALAAGPAAKRLVALTLDRCRLDNGCLGALQDLLQAAGRLRRLGLSQNFLDDAGARALARCPALARLHEINVFGNDMSDAGREALAASPYRHPWLRLLPRPGEA
jgi:hypothetical protein